MKNIFFYDTKIGRFAIMDNGKEITDMEIADFINTKDMNVYETELIKQAAEQLMEYLEGSRKTFDLPLNPQGTEFQKSVWNVLCNIPYGETRSYKQVAVAIGNPKACRAVGLANNKNPIMIFIPCHRVVGLNGSLVGYAGGLDLKEKLLSIEKGTAVN